MRSKPRNLKQPRYFRFAETQGHTCCTCCRWATPHGYYCCAPGNGGPECDYQPATCKTEDTLALSSAMSPGTTGTTLVRELGNGATVRDLRETLTALADVRFESGRKAGRIEVANAVLGIHRAASFGNHCVTCGVRVPCATLRAVAGVLA